MDGSHKQFFSFFFFFCHHWGIRAYTRLVPQRPSRAGPTDAEEFNSWVAARDRTQVELNQGASFHQQTTQRGQFFDTSQQLIFLLITSLKLHVILELICSFMDYAFKIELFKQFSMEFGPPQNMYHKFDIVES